MKKIIVLVVAILCCACHEAPTRQVRQELVQAWTDYFSHDWCEVSQWNVEAQNRYRQYLDDQTIPNWENYLEAKSKANRIANIITESRDRADSLESVLLGSGYNKHQLLKLEREGYDEAVYRYTEAYKKYMRRHRR